MSVNRQRLDRKRIEQLLEDSLVPVEPNSSFVSDLRARLVTVEGDQVLSPWMLVLIMASIVIFILSALGFILRIVLALLGLVGLMERRRRDSSASA
jgi:small-conductance mechanosensitive channel